MNFKTELSKWGYNKGNSVDVETLIDEILPELFSKQEKSYSEEDMEKSFEAGRSYEELIQSQKANLDWEGKIDYKPKSFKEWFEQFKKKGL